jgi:hypothetical protein
MTLLLFLLACTTTSASSAPTCALEGTLDAAMSAAPGDIVSIALSPMTETFDTVVTVGSARAEGVTVTRDGCDACDDCRDADTGCSDCGACPGCEEDCAACLESVGFVVPSLPSGTYEVRVTNTHGTSAPFMLELVTPDSPEDTSAAR